MYRYIFSLSIAIHLYSTYSSATPNTVWNSMPLDSSADLPPEFTTSHISFSTSCLATEELFSVRVVRAPSTDGGIVYHFRKTTGIVYLFSIGNAAVLHGSKCNGRADRALDSGTRMRSARGGGRGQDWTGQERCAAAAEDMIGQDKGGAWRRPRQDKDKSGARRRPRQDKRKGVVARCFYSRKGTNKLLREEGKRKKEIKKEVGNGSC